MRFRERSSFNMRDSSTLSDRGRLVIRHNLEKRCDLVLKQVAAFKSKGVTIDVLMNSLNEGERYQYTESDILYALKRLRAEKIVEVQDDNKWVACKAAIKVWEKREVQWI